LLKSKQYHKRTHKFGFEVPKTVTNVQRDDKEHGDDRWATAIKKETDKVQVAFKRKRLTKFKSHSIYCQEEISHQSDSNELVYTLSSMLKWRTSNLKPDW
jgi:hypothetical protein